MIMMIMKLYNTNSMWHVQMRFTVSMHEIETKALKGPLAAFRYTAHVWSPISEYCIYGRGQVTAPGKFPHSFREACEFFKVPRMGLVKDERLGQWLSVPTQGRREAQTGTKPFSLTMPGSDPQSGIDLGPHWRAEDVLTTQPDEHLQAQVLSSSFSPHLIST